MKFWGIFRFEFGYQIRRPWPWVFAAVLLVVCFLMTRDAALADALYEDFFVNAPFAIAVTTVVGGLIWLMVAPAVAGEAAARDVGTGMYPLTYTLPISKAEYLGGRFLAALALNALILLGVQAGILLAVYSPGVPAEVIGPFRPAAYLTAYAFIGLPNAIVATALQFSVATRSGRAMASYVGSVFLVFMGFFVASLLLYKRGLGTLLDPIGIRFLVEDLAHEWTTIERKTRLIGLDGVVLSNRLVWLGVAVAVLAFTYLRFRFAHRVESSWWRRKSRRAAHSPSADIEVTASTPIAVPAVPLSFGFAIDARKMLAIAWESFRAIATSWAGLAMLIAIPMLTVLVVIDQMATVGVPLVPRTVFVLKELTGPLSAELSRWVIVPLLMVFFAGELVWREREAGLGEITDAMPGSEWAPLLGKFLGLGLVLVTFMTLLTAAGVLAQIIMGYHNVELGLYLKILFGLQLPEYLLFTMFALVVHVLADQKYVGHLLGIMAYVFVAVLAPVIGIEHNLLVYGAGPGWSYSDMRGFGSFIAPWAWFKLYWAAWAVMLAVVAKLLWVRGREGGLRVRLKRARRRFSGPVVVPSRVEFVVPSKVEFVVPSEVEGPALRFVVPRPAFPTIWIAAIAAALILTLGGFIFYNTNVRNEYLSSSDLAERSATYEKRYGRYANLPQPELTGTTLRVEIYPKRRAADIRGSYRLVNRSAVSIDSVHVVTATRGVETRTLTFGRAATLAVDDPEHGYRIYALGKPLEPGDTLRLDFDVHAEPHGFTNRGVDPSVVANGSYFTGAAWLPSVGYQRGRELISAASRRTHGLAPRPVIASLYSEEGRAPAARGGGIAFEAVVGTDDGQVGVAPGALRRTWTEGDRRYFQYSTDAPIGSEWAFFSANYAVHEAKWNNVAIRIFHHPDHTGHLNRMTRGVQASLDYYSKQFGPYPYGHLNIVESPGRIGIGMHAEASMVSYGEGVPFWIPKPGRLDFPYAVLGHEMAHQWTLPYAPVEGAPFLSEGLAWFSAMQLIEATRGSEEHRRLLVRLRQPSPFRPIRRGEPLLRALDPYLSYRTGPFAMYALSEYVGADRVNGALRRLIARHDSVGTPRATTLDLYRELQAVTPDSLKALLHDLFEVNTLWQLKTERVAAQQTGEGTWQVTLDVTARKFVYDSAGVETDVPMDEWIPIGVFAAAGEGKDELGAPIYVQKHRVHSGKQAITLTVSRKPTLAGIDPYHLLDWEELDDDDNIDVVKIGP